MSLLILVRHFINDLRGDELVEQDLGVENASVSTYPSILAKGPCYI